MARSARDRSAPPSPVAGRPGRWRRRTAAEPIVLRPVGTGTRCGCRAPWLAARSARSSGPRPPNASCRRSCRQTPRCLRNCGSVARTCRSPLRREEQVEEQAAQPRRDRWTVRRRTVQAVSHANGIVAVEADPGLELFDERRVVHLDGVALNHVLEHLLHRVPFGHQQHPHAIGRARALKQAQFLLRQRLRVVFAPGALPLRNGLEQRRGLGLGRAERHPDSIACGVEAGLALEPMGQRSLDQVLGGTTQRDEQMMVVRINRGTTPRQVRQDRDGLVFNCELPALCVVTGRRQRCVADELLAERRAFEAIQGAKAPRSTCDGLVTLGVRTL